MSLDFRRLLVALGLAAGAAAVHAAPACPAILSQTLPRLQDEKPVDLCQFAGKVVLVVNTASQCGFTPQYKSLEALNEKYKDRGLVVLGFPSNDFAQESGSNAEIAQFCENQYAVRFPMFAKSSVRPNAKSQNPLYAALVRKSGQPPLWNFHKYLIDRKGDKVASVVTDVDPLAPSFVARVEKLLAEK